MQFILASSSANRRQLFDRLGIAYTVHPPTYEEYLIPSADATTQACTFAEGKAHSVLPHYADGSDTLIMGFDSVIEHEGLSLGKPENRDDCARMLRSFIGKEQYVHTGVCICGSFNGEPFSLARVQSTRVTFRGDILPHEIESYLDFNDFGDKCGGYSILGPGIFLLASIEGDFQNIVGVPTLLLGQMIHDATGQSPLALVQATPPKSR